MKLLDNHIYILNNREELRLFKPIINSHCDSKIDSDFMPSGNYPIGILIEERTNTYITWCWAAIAYFKDTLPYSNYIFIHYSSDPIITELLKVVM